MEAELQGDNTEMYGFWYWPRDVLSELIGQDLSKVPWNERERDSCVHSYLLLFIRFIKEMHRPQFDGLF